MRRLPSAVVLALLAPRFLSAAPAPSTQPTDVDPQLLSSIESDLAAGSAQKALTTAKQAMSAVGRLPVGQITNDSVIRLFDLTAIAHLKLNQAALAQKAEARAFGSPKTSRSIVLNLATAETQVKSFVNHAADVAAVYCDNHPDDVEAMDLYGTIIDRAVKAKTGTKSLQPHIDRYTALVAKLEATRPGEHRWGTKWINGIDWTLLNEKRDQSARRIRNQQSDVDAAEAALKSRQIELRNAQLDSSRRLARYPRNLEYENNRVASARQDLDREQKQLASFQKDAPMPEWAAPLTGVAYDPNLKDK